MPDYKGGLQSAATLGAMGASFGPIGAGIGAAIGLVSGLFGESEEEIRQRRKKELLEKLRAAYLSSVERVSGLAMDQAAFAQQAAARQAASKGIAGGARAADVAAAVNPVYRQSGEVVGRLGEQFNQQVFSVESDFAGRPIEPSWSDVLTSSASNAINAYTAIQRGENIKEDVSQATSGGGASPEFTAGAGITPLSQGPTPGPSDLTFQPGGEVNPNMPTFQPGASKLGATTTFGGSFSNKPELQGRFGEQYANSKSTGEDTDEPWLAAMKAARRSYSNPLG